MHHLWIPVYVKCSFTIAKEKDCVVYMSESRLIEWMQLWCRHEWRTSRLITAVFSSLSLPSRYFSHLKLMTWDHCISPPVRPKTTAKQNYHHSGKRGEDWGGRGILPAGSVFWVVFFLPSSLLHWWYFKSCSYARILADDYSHIIKSGACFTAMKAGCHIPPCC